MKNFNECLNQCESISDYFDLVKKVAYYYLGKDQAGLMVGLSDLGRYRNGFVGAFYSLNANMIIINDRILKKVKKTNPELLKPYIFHILLHEYIHSLGYYDESQTRQLTFDIATKLKDQQIIMLAKDMSKFFPNIVISNNFEPPDDLNIDFVSGIDKKNLNYIN